MWHTGVIYVPSACADGDECTLHIHLHGCLTAMEFQGDYYYTNAGFNEVAEANNLIILYPQIGSDETTNP